MFQGFEARGTEIRGRQDALDNIISVIENGWLPYDIHVNRKDFNFNEQLFDKSEPEYLAGDWFSDDPGNNVTEARRRRRSIHGKGRNYEDFRMMIMNSGSSDADHSRLRKHGHDFKRHVDDVKRNLDYDRWNIANVRRKRQATDCTSRWFSKILLIIM